MVYTQITQQEINLFNTERTGTSNHVIIEGLHAFKHAYRFCAVMKEIYVCNKKKVVAQMEALAGPKEALFVNQHAQELTEDDFARLAPRAVRTGIITRAEKPSYDIRAIDDKGYIVVLEDPRDLDNVGAVIRASAAKGVDAVITKGEVRPWNANALRVSAGLHFAQPVFALPSIKEIHKQFPHRNIVACSDEGENMYDALIAYNSILIFGTERDGITEHTKMYADQIVSIPMQKGVSSMNLATSVSAILFGV